MQEQLLTALLPNVKRESLALTPYPAMNINAFIVFDAIRNLSDPPLTETEFNRLADQIES
jgi:hypothetical protein